jgi:hypothetical protein
MFVKIRQGPSVVRELPPGHLGLVLELFSDAVRVHRQVRDHLDAHPLEVLPRCADEVDSSHGIRHEGAAAEDREVAELIRLGSRGIVVPEQSDQIASKSLEAVAAREHDRRCPTVVRPGIEPVEPVLLARRDVRVPHPPGRRWVHEAVTLRQHERFGHGQHPPWPRFRVRRLPLCRERAEGLGAPSEVALAHPEGALQGPCLQRSGAGPRRERPGARFRRARTSRRAPTADRCSRRGRDPLQRETRRSPTATVAHPPNSHEQPP